MSQVQTQHSAAELAPQHRMRSLWEIVEQALFMHLMEMPRELRGNIVQSGS